MNQNCWFLTKKLMFVFQKKSWHDWEIVTQFWVNNLEVCHGKNCARMDKIVARFWITFGIVLCTNVKSWHDWCKLRHDLTRSETLFKQCLTYLLSKVGESHGNQRRKLLRYIYTKGWRSLGEIQSLKMWILNNQKRRALGKGLVPFEERIMGSGNTSKESLCEHFGESWETKREDP